MCANEKMNVCANTNMCAYTFNFVHIHSTYKVLQGGEDS